MAERRWTILELLSEATAFLGRRGIESPRVNAEVMLGHALGLPRVSLYARFDAPVPPEPLTAFREMVRRRLDRVPLQYVTGGVEFWSRHFLAREGVFIPRPETEVLVEKAVVPLAGRSDVRFAEIGVGSGALLVTALLELPGSTAVGTDVSAAAIALAGENAARHGVAERVELREGSLLAALEGSAKGSFDLILSNPPYLADGEIDALAPEVRVHEPRAALSSGPEGLEAIRTIVLGAGEWLRPGGTLGMEIGETQGEAVLALVRGAEGWEDARVEKDYAGKDRVLVARRKGG